MVFCCSFGTTKGGKGTTDRRKPFGTKMARPENSHGQELLSRVHDAGKKRKKASTNFCFTEFLRRKSERPDSEVLSAMSRRNEEAKEKDGDGNNPARVIPSTKGQGKARSHQRGRLKGSP